MQSQTVGVRVYVSDEGRLLARVSGCPDLVEADDIVELREKVELLVRMTYGEGRRVSLIV